MYLCNADGKTGEETKCKNKREKSKNVFIIENALVPQIEIQNCIFWESGFLRHYYPLSSHAINSFELLKLHIPYQWYGMQEKKPFDTHVMCTESSIFDALWCEMFLALYFFWFVSCTLFIIELNSTEIIKNALHLMNKA